MKYEDGKYINSNDLTTTIGERIKCGESLIIQLKNLATVDEMQIVVS